MEKVIINSYEEFEKLVGQQIGVSDYVELSQERINLFAWPRVGSSSWIMEYSKNTLSCEKMNSSAGLLPSSFS